MAKNAILGKWLAVGIILLFVEASVGPAIAQMNQTHATHSSQGSWWYVGGSGPGNYTKIQDAINSAHDGDTVFVYAGVYFENITVYHAITVLGENVDTTIIDGYETDDVVSITKPEARFSGFTVQNSSLFGGAGIKVLAYGGSVDISTVHVTDNTIGVYLKDGIGTLLHNALIDKNTETGVYVQSSRSEICDNIIANNRYFGIVLLHENVDYTVIKNNVITNSREGIWVSDLYETSHLELINNIIMNSSTFGVKVGTVDSTIQGNQFCNNSLGLIVVSGQRNDIRENTFLNNTRGLYLVDVGHNRIHRNNFIQNQQDAFFTYFLFVHTPRNYWYHNYWDGHHLPVPKPIKGHKVFLIPFSVWVNLSWVQFDPLPALQPFTIPEM